MRVANGTQATCITVMFVFRMVIVDVVLLVALLLALTVFAWYDWVVVVIPTYHHHQSLRRSLTVGVRSEMERLVCFCPIPRWGCQSRIYSQVMSDLVV